MAIFILKRSRGGPEIRSQTYFGNNGRLFVKCAEMLGALPVDIGDFGMDFPVFPHIRVQLVLWAGDEEFPADATILFDESVQRILSAEDIAVMCGSLVYRLIGLGRKIQSGCLIHDIVGGSILKIAVTGKGGVGKTTLSAFLVKWFAEQGEKCSCHRRGP